MRRSIPLILALVGLALIANLLFPSNVAIIVGFIAIQLSVVVLSMRAMGRR